MTSLPHTPTSQAPTAPLLEVTDLVREYTLPREHLLRVQVAVDRPEIRIGLDPPRETAGEVARGPIRAGKRERELVELRTAEQSLHREVVDSGPVELPPGTRSNASPGATQTVSPSVSSTTQSPSSPPPPATVKPIAPPPPGAPPG